jgi:hypothetical protein
MALLHFDGFDHYSTTVGDGGISDFYSQVNNNGGAALTTTTRFGVGQCYYNPVLYKQLATINGYQQMTVGLSAQLFTQTTSPAPAFSVMVTGLVDYANHPVVSLMYNGENNRLYLYDSTVTQGDFATFSTTLEQLPGLIDFYALLTTDSWNYIETCVNISTGLVQVYLNGGLIMNHTGVNLGSTSISAWTCLNGFYGADQAWNIDDLYISDSAVPFGDSRIITLFPAADVSVAFAPSHGGHNYSLVSNVVAVANNYVYSNVVGTADLYSLTPFGYDPATIHATKVTALVSKDISGNRFVDTVLKSGTTTVEGANAAVATSYTFVEDIYTNDPNTGTLWSRDAVANSQIGLMIKS